MTIKEGQVQIQILLDLKKSSSDPSDWNSCVLQTRGFDVMVS